MNHCNRRAEILMGLCDGAALQVFYKARLPTHDTYDCFNRSWHIIWMAPTWLKDTPSSFILGDDEKIRTLSFLEILIQPRLNQSMVLLNHIVTTIIILPPRHPQYYYYHHYHIMTTITTTIVTNYHHYDHNYYRLLLCPTKKCISELFWREYYQFSSRKLLSHIVGKLISQRLRWNEGWRLLSGYL